MDRARIVDAGLGIFQLPYRVMPILARRSHQYLACIQKKWSVSMKHHQRGGWMSLALPVVGPLCLAATMAVSLTTAGCAEHHYYRVYDPYYRDYHVWNDNEVVYSDGRPKRITIRTATSAKFRPTNRRTIGPGATATNEDGPPLPKQSQPRISGFSYL
jgi:hypothetical protein